jgi:hypothetical protein
MLGIIRVERRQKERVGFAKVADKRAIFLQYQWFAGRSGALVCVEVD